MTGPIAAAATGQAWTPRPLTMTAERRSAFATIARQRFDAHEAILAPAITEAIDVWLDACRTATGIDSLPSSLAADASPAEPARDPAQIARLPKALRQLMHGDPDAFVAVIKSQTNAWSRALDAKIMPAYADMLDKVIASGLADKRTAEGLRTWRAAWLAQRRQALVGVPDAMSDVLRTGLSTIAKANGTSVYDAMHAVRGMLSNGYPSWTNRANLIARTETVSANNQGALTQYAALADATGSAATKTWLATEDARTREDHAAVDGTTVGMDELFSVGDDQMNGPGDTNADVGQLANCRCTMTYDFPDGTA